MPDALSEFNDKIIENYNAEESNSNTTLSKEEIGKIASALWNEYNEIMYKIAFSILRNRPDAEDAVNDTFCRILKHIDNFHGEKATNVKSLIIIYTKGTSINNYNKLKRDLTNSISTYNEEGEYIDIVDTNMPTPEIELENKETTQLVSKLLSKLDDKYRDVLVLKYFQGMKDSEIAEALGLTVNNVDVRVHRAKKQLFKMINSNPKIYKILMRGSEHNG